METGNGSVSNEGILHMNNYAQDTKFKNVGIHCWTVFPVEYNLKSAILLVKINIKPNWIPLVYILNISSNDREMNLKICLVVIYYRIEKMPQWILEYLNFHWVNNSITMDGLSPNSY